jgi:Cdc6-like AAA superfamily ATPase
MPKKASYEEVPIEKLRWRLDPATLPFKSTDELEPLDEIVGQKRAVEAFKFGMGIDSQGYNVFVTGMAGTGRMSTVRKMLEEISCKDRVPDDLCYINNFKNAETPILIRLKGERAPVLRKIFMALWSCSKNRSP